MYAVDRHTFDRPLSVVVAGGGTGGHLFPGIALAGEFMRRQANSRILFVGAGRPMEHEALARAGFALRTIAIEGIKGRGLTAKLKAVMKIPGAVWRSATILTEAGADLMIGMGGYAAGPVALAARLKGIPVVLCEQNTVPGITNRILLPLAKRIYISFENTVGRIAASKRRLTGNPVRQRIREASECPVQPSDVLTVLVVGGSQGAHAINEAMVAASTRVKYPMHIIHQTGSQDCNAVARAYKDAGITAEVQAFFHDMATRYQRADLVICRAGATTVAELTVLGKPAILIPYPFAADNHQERNAASMVDNGAAQMIRERDLSAGDLARRLEKLIQAPHELTAMAARSRMLGKPGAAAVIVDDCYELLGEPCT